MDVQGVLETDQLAVWTIGHSTRTLEDFITVLTTYRIEALVDVRRFPGSRRLPHFHGATLAEALGARCISYYWLEALGGRRRPDPQSLNVAWRQPAFRAYADYLATEEFADALWDLLMIASGLRTAIMCAEVLWWRCHRRLIADVLTSLDVPVVHIRDERAAETHRLVPPARMVNGVLTYA
jgi:uncharacterized protein (DUF488 family)